MSEVLPTFINKRNLRQLRLLAELFIDFSAATVSGVVLAGEIYHEFILEGSNSFEAKDIAISLGSAAFGFLFLREGLYREKEFVYGNELDLQTEQVNLLTSEFGPDMVQLTDQAAVNSGSFIK